MPSQETTIPNIIKIEKIEQYQLTALIAQQKVFQGGVLNDNYVQLMYMYRKAVEFVNTTTPNYPTLRQTAEYLFALLQPFWSAAQQIVNNNTATITISNPANQNVLVGASATFSVVVTVSNGAPYVIQWFRNGVAIVGATGTSYTLTNAQLTDSGALFSATATAAGVGTASSLNALLTVTQVIQAFWWYGNTDPFPALNGGSDTLIYEVTTTITHNNPISITYPFASEDNQYTVLKFPITENTKTLWFNTSLNNGQIPDGIMRATITIGSFQYVVSRVAMSLDSTATTLVYS